MDKDIPEPGNRQVRIKVQAWAYAIVIPLPKKGCSCIQYPRVPGHEIAGFIDKVGTDVTQWESGQRVAVGWHGGHDGTCESCRRGDFVTCKNLQVPGISDHAGYADYMIAPSKS